MTDEELLMNESEDTIAETAEDLKNNIALIMSTPGVKKLVKSYKRERHLKTAATITSIGVGITTIVATGYIIKKIHDHEHCSEDTAAFHNSFD